MLAPLAGHRRRLVGAYLKRFPDLAGMVQRKWKGLYWFCRSVGVKDDEIESAAMWGVCRAAQDFEPRRVTGRNRFQRYAGFWIQDKVQREAKATPNYRASRQGRHHEIVNDLPDRPENVPPDPDDVTRAVALVGKLTAKEWQTVCWRFGLGGVPRMKLREIAAVRGVTKEAVRQVIARVVKLLRKRAGSE